MAKPTTLSKPGPSADLDPVNGSTLTPGLDLLSPDTAPVHDPGPGRPLQITVSADVEILLALLCARWASKGFRPSARTKSALINTAVKFLADHEQITLPKSSATP